MNKKIIGMFLISIGLIGLIILLFVSNSGLVSSGCFGRNYFYELITFGIPILLIVTGLRVY